jgi:anti-sigma factor RsiW
MTACARRDDAGSYVLHALPDDEHERFEAHLATCPDCRREVADLQVAADTLPLAAVQVGPPPELRDRIMTIVRSEAELLAAAGARADEPAAAPAAKPPRTRRRWSLSLRPLPAAMAASALVAAGVIGGIVLTGADHTKTVTGTVQIASAPAARASLQLSDDATKLEVRRMPAPPAGKVYQVWLKRPNQDPAPTTALFRTDRRGSADVENQRGRLKGVDQVLVTAEPDGGSMQPTSAPVIVASAA